MMELTYTYKCTPCDNIFDARATYDQRDEQQECPLCNNGFGVKRIMHTSCIKGNGIEKSRN